MFIGLYPSQSKLAAGEVDVLSLKTPVLAEILKDIGYHTMCFAENVFITKKYGLTRGFDEQLQVWDINPWIRNKYTFSNILIQINKFDRIVRQRFKSQKALTFWYHIILRS